MPFVRSPGKSTTKYTKHTKELQRRVHKGEGKEKGGASWHNPQSFASTCTSDYRMYRMVASGVAQMRPSTTQTPRSTFAFPSKIMRHVPTLPESVLMTIGSSTLLVGRVTPDTTSVTSLPAFSVPMDMSACEASIDQRVLSATVSESTSTNDIPLFATKFVPHQLLAAKPSME